MPPVIMIYFLIQICIVSHSLSIHHDYRFYYMHFPPSFKSLRIWKENDISFNTSIVVKSKSKLFLSSLLIWDNNSGVMNGFGDILYISTNRKNIVFQTSSTIIYNHPLCDWLIETQLLCIYLPAIFVLVSIICHNNSKHIIVSVAFIPIYFQIMVQPKAHLSNLSFLYFGQSNFRSFPKTKLFNGSQCHILYNSHPYDKQDIFTSMYHHIYNLGNIDRLEYGDFIFIKCDLAQKAPKNTSIVLPNYIKLSDSYNPRSNWSIIIPFYWELVNMGLEHFMNQMVFDGTKLYKQNKIPKFTKKLLNRTNATKGFSYGIITLTRMSDTHIYSLAGAFDHFDESISGVKCVLMDNYGNVDYNQFIGYLVKPINNEYKNVGNMCIRPNHPKYKTAYTEYIQPLLSAL